MFTTRAALKVFKCDSLACSCRIDLGLGELAVTFDDLISALLGSLLLLLGIWIFKKTRGKSKSAPET